MRIVVTGASGLVGRSVVPLLARSGAELLVVGRDPALLGRLLPRHSCCTYAEIPGHAAEFDLLVHLAVLNNDTQATDAEYTAVNVTFLLDTVKLAIDAKISRFVNVSTVHALDPRNNSGYAKSKREVAERLTAVTGIEIETVYLPAVIADEFAGRLAFLNRLPRWLARPLTTFLAALKPTVSASRLAEFVLACGQPRATDERIMILANDQSQNPVFTACKRSLDLAFALSAVGLLWWLFIVIWLLVKATSPGPGIFAQQRVGKDLRPFTCYKFRTMKWGAPQAGTHEVSASLVTRIGRLLRSTKLDELPQVWNILQNEISLVGPRPCLFQQKELVKQRLSAGVLSIKPGITGLAQVEGIDMSDPAELVSWDSRYLALRSLLLDFKIIVRTAIGRGRGDRVANFH